MNLIPLSLVKSNIIPMMATDVAQDGTTSSTHISVAKAKMAMMRCWTMVSPSIPKDDEGRFHNSNVTKSTKMASADFVNTLLGWKRFSWRTLW